MKLNHLDLQVEDVPGTVALFERVFGMRCTSNRASPAIAFLSDGEGFSLVLQRLRAGARYPEGFHLGFVVGDVQTVHEVRERAVLEAGVTASEVIVNGRGTLLYCRMPEGYLVEVSCPPG